MRLLFVLLVAATAHASCVDGVCVPWMDLPDPVRVGLRIVPVAPAGGVLTVQRVEGGRRWTFAATAAQVAELRSLLLPAGSYVVTVELERHRPAMRKVDVPPGAAFAFGAIGLTRMPRIEGEVRRADGKPLAGARVALHPQGGAVTTTANGRFAIDVDGDWPSHVVITRPGLGTRVVPLGPSVGDVTLAPVTLRRGATLRLRVARGAETGPIDADLLTHDGQPVRIATGTLRPGRSAMVFDDLDRGVYAVLLRGPEPLQRMVLFATVNRDHSAIEVSLPDERAAGTVTLGGEPLRGATVELHREGFWGTSVVTDAKGELTSKVWQRTDLLATVSGGGLPSLRLVSLPAGAGLSIDLPAREVRGTVVNDRGKPVTRGRVALEIDEEERRTYLRAQPDAAGRYGFAGLDAGRFALHAEGEGYLRTDPIEVAVAGDQAVVEQQIVLETAYPRALEIVDAAGRPATGAAVVCAVGGRIRATATTDLDGRATIGTPAGPGVLFVLPREASLAVVRLPPAPEGDAPVHRIVIPPGEAKVDITATAGDAPLPGVSLLMRFNGELLTPQIARELRFLQRSSLRTGDDGRATLAQMPAGYYEFWPYQSEEEAAMLMESSVAMAAPIALYAAKGENHVRVRFDEVRRP